MGNKLPAKLPDEWLTQIKEAVKPPKPSIWVIIAGSSLLAAALTSLSNFWLARINFEHERDKQAAESRFKIEEEDLKKKRDAYDVLSKELSKLLDSLDAHKKNWQVSAQDPALALKPLRLQLADLQDAKSECLRLDKDAEQIGKAVAGVQQWFGPGINVTNDGQPNTPPFIGHITEVQEAIKKAIEQIDQRKSQLRPQRISLCPRHNLVSTVEASGRRLNQNEGMKLAALHAFSFQAYAAFWMPVAYRSTAIATALPPPRHKAARPRRTSRRCIS